jgi:formate/nitrite transporter FocA (FNT family)
VQDGLRQHHTVLGHAKCDLVGYGIFRHMVSMQNLIFDTRSHSVWVLIWCYNLAGSVLFVVLMYVSGIFHERDWCGMPPIMLFVIGMKNATGAACRPLCCLLLG